MCACVLILMHMCPQASDAARRASVGGGDVAAATVVAAPIRSERVAGPFRGMCGEVHMLHRCFFDALNGDAAASLTLGTAKGLVSVEELADSACTAVLQLRGGGGGTNRCHRSARYCLHLSRNKEAEGGGWGGGGISGLQIESQSSLSVFLEAGPEFLAIDAGGHMFRCKIKVAPGIYIYIYICIYIDIGMYRYVYTHTHTHSHTHTHTHNTHTTHTHTCMHMCMHIHIHIHIHVYTCY
jgi:hypothetical protein